MLAALSPEDVYACDEAGVRAGTPLATMMRRAGAAVAREARSMLGGSYGRRILVLCGKGNNGGDGLVAASMLAARGAKVTVGLVLDDDFHGEAAAARRAWTGETIHGPEGLQEHLDATDLLIDAIFGVGLSRPVTGPIAPLIRAASEHRVLAVDLPSGIDARTGQVLGTAIRAERTVSFTGPKLGLLFEPGRAHAGQIVIEDIGAVDAERSARIVEEPDVASAWPRRRETDHKRNAGRLLVVAGSRSMPGAAILTTRAAVRAGAGMTTVLAPSMIAKSIAGAVPEATTIPADATSEGALSLEAAASIVPELDGFHALAIGPGMGRGDETAEAIRTLLAAFTGAAIVDADALHALGSAKRPTGARTVVTPHAGEWSAMLDAPAGELHRDRLAAATRLQAHLAAGIGDTTVVLKGPGTVITDGEVPFVDVLGGRELAQGGSGDVLTGLLAGLAAQFARRGEFDAYLTAIGVWVHSAAGARMDGPTGATMLIDQIPRVLAEVLA